MTKIMWTDDEIQILHQCYLQEMSISDIVKLIPRHTQGAIATKAQKMGYSKEIIRNNNANFTAIYQDYDWCYERYINKGMSHMDMALEAGCSRRVIEKWCSDKFQLNVRTFRQLKQLNNIQKEMILAGRLGDGHITNNDKPLYIESHAENQKDYMWWKYSVLKDICASPPKKYDATEKVLNGKTYNAQTSYRLTTRVIDAFYELREYPRIEIIRNITPFQLSLLMLDDGYCGQSWQLCVAAWTPEEIALFIDICHSRYGLECHQNKDVRYIAFPVESSKKLNKVILDNIPNNLDIIRYKILDNRKISKEIAV